MAASHQRVTQGGLFSTRRPNISRETQDLLKVMMDESKLTSYQQRQLTNQIKGGKPLPRHIAPTSHAPPTSNQRRPKIQQPSSRRCGLRTRETIAHIESTEENTSSRSSQCARVTRYNSSIEKDKLQKLMANENDETHQMVNNKQQEVEKERTFEEILEEISEREQFLNDMETLGRRKEYEHIILSEISQKVRELELIDKEKKL